MRVLIVDDDEDVVFSLQTILCAKGVEVVGTGTDGSEAVKLYEELQPDILLMDIQMKPMNGLDAAEQILAEDKTARVLFLTTFSDDEYIVKALRLGTKGYLLKQDHNSILPALQAVYSGQTVFGTEIISKIPELLQSSDGFDYASRNISERELDIIRLIANGYSNKEIAAELFLSEGTVRNYLSMILEKLQLRDRTQVAVFYYQHK